MMQPYAWLFANGFLKVDDRTWPTAYRGPVILHASKKFHAPYYAFLRQRTDWHLPAPGAFEAGGVVGIAELVNCLAPTAPAGSPFTQGDLERAHFGAPGYYGFELAKARPLPFLAYRGNVGLFDIPDAVLAGIPGFVEARER